MYRRKALLAAILAAFLLLVTPSAYADDYVQIGSAGTDSSNPAAFGAASKISQPALGSYTPNIDRFYWIGITFQDGTFYQAGWKDEGANSTCSSLLNFVAVIKPKTSQYHQNAGQCGLTGTRTFGLVLVNSNGDNSTWAAQMDNQELYGNRITAPSFFKGNDAIAVSEAATTGTFSNGANQYLASATYSPAAHIRYSNGSWGPQAHGKVYRGYKGTNCPFYHIQGQGGSAFRAWSDSGTSNCPADGVQLW